MHSSVHKPISIHTYRYLIIHKDFSENSCNCNWNYSYVSTFIFSYNWSNFNVYKT